VPFTVISLELTKAAFKILTPQSVMSVLKLFLRKNWVRFGRIWGMVRWTGLVSKEYQRLTSWSFLCSETDFLRKKFGLNFWNQLSPLVNSVPEQSCLSNFWRRSLSSQYDDIAVMSFVMSKGKFERTAFSLSGLGWLRCLNLLLLQIRLTWMSSFGGVVSL